LNVHDALIFVPLSESAWIAFCMSAVHSASVL